VFDSASVLQFLPRDAKIMVATLILIKIDRNIGFPDREAACSILSNGCSNAWYHIEGK
jgi:hypothetical protein